MTLFELLSGLLPENPVRAPGDSYPDKFLTNFFSGSGKSHSVPSPGKGALTANGALTEIKFSGIIFRALAGIPGKSPGVLTE